MRITKYLLATLAAAALVACGGGNGDDSTAVASDVPAVSINAQNGAVAAQALNGQAISFANGVPAFGTSGATTLTVTAGASPTFGVSSGGSSATGSLRFGSCIFEVTSSTFTAPHPLQQGAVVTVADCAIDFNTANVSAEGGTATVQATVSLNGTVSSPVTTTVVIQSNGDVLVNGTKITSASVTQVTGGS